MTSLKRLSWELNMIILRICAVYRLHTKKMMIIIVIINNNNSEMLGMTAHACNLNDLGV